MATLDKAQPKIAVADIVRFGEKLVIPDGMALDEAMALLKRRQEYDSQATTLVATFEAFPYDGAVMLDRVLNRRYGWSPQIGTPGFFRENPPTLVWVNTGHAQVQQVPWGRFKLPNVEGWIETDVDRSAGRFRFRIISEVLRRDEPVVKALLDELRQEIATNSIYRGKAIRIQFLDNDGHEVGLPEPKFLDTDSVNPEMLILSEHLHRAVQTNLFTPITRSADCMLNGIAIKRGVLLGGTFGTGKTMIAHVASKLAVDAGITFLYISKAAELAHAIEFARQYQSPACVIFCEDIDREVSGERTEEMDDILNTIDGIDSKTSNIIVVLTTNAIHDIHPAMLRPGRLDAVLDITPPDAKAIERLIRAYAADALEDGIDLAPVSAVLAGNIPAVIAEVVKRAKLSQLSLQAPDTRVTKLGSDALLDAALTIQAQVKLLNPTAPEPSNRLHDVFVETVRQAFNGNSELIASTARQVERIVNKVT